MVIKEIRGEKRSIEAIDWLEVSFIHNGKEECLWMSEEHICDAIVEYTQKHYKSNSIEKNPLIIEFNTIDGDKKTCKSNQ